MKTTTRFAIASPVQLSWFHYGVPHRATTWPEVRFERRPGRCWIAESPSGEVFASAAATLDETDWWSYLDFVPAEVRRFLEQFRFGRLEALQVIARCPALFADLRETPALTPFVAAHALLRGTGAGCWDEISAVHERSGVFGLLEWLGLPASRQTLGILLRVADPDVPRRHLEPLRTQLWEPGSIFVLQGNPGITDRQLDRFCHADAA